MEVLDAELWQLVDRRLDEVRGLPYAKLLRRASAAPEVELLERPSGVFSRRTRVVTLPRDRLGISVRVTVQGRRRPAEGGIAITSSGALAPEWSRSGEPPRGNPFAFGRRTTLAGLALCAATSSSTNCPRGAVTCPRPDDRRDRERKRSTCRCERLV